MGRCSNNLNTSGDEIYGPLPCPISARPMHVLSRNRLTDLVGGITDTDVEVRQVCFEEIAHDDIKLAFKVEIFSVLEALRELERHSRVHFYHREMLAVLLEDLHRQVARAWAYLQHLVRRLEIGLLYYCLRY